MKHPKAKDIIKGLVEMFREQLQNVIFINSYLTNISDSDLLMIDHYDMVK